MFSQVLVTEELHGFDDRNSAGIIINKKGDVKQYQTVVAVGDDVKQVKPGDVVVINFYKYVELKEDLRSVKAIGGNSAVGLHLNEVEMVDENGEPTTCFLIDQRDIMYILKDYDEVAYTDNDSLQKAGKSLILPTQKIIV